MRALREPEKVTSPATWRSPCGRARSLSLDSYYRELADLTFDERCGFNFDHPDALDRKLLVQQLREIAADHVIDQPFYQFETHSRASECTRFAPSPFVIL